MLVSHVDKALLAPVVAPLRRFGAAYAQQTRTAPGGVVDSWRATAYQGELARRQQMQLAATSPD